MASSDTNSASQSGDSPQVAVEPVARATKKARLASEEHIKYLCTRCIELANSGDFTNPFWFKHMGENFTWDTFNVHRESSRAEHLEFMTKLIEKNPRWHATVKDINVDVQEKLGRGKCWCIVTITGEPDGIEKEALHIFFYRRGEDGTWFSTRHHGFQGVAPLPLPFEAAEPEEEG